MELAAYAAKTAIHMGSSLGGVIWQFGLHGGKQLSASTHYTGI